MNGPLRCDEQQNFEDDGVFFVLESLVLGKRRDHTDPPHPGPWLGAEYI